MHLSTVYKIMYYCLFSFICSTCAGCFSQRPLKTESLDSLSPPVVHVVRHVCHVLRKAAGHCICASVYPATPTSFINGTDRNHSQLSVNEKKTLVGSQIRSLAPRLRTEKYVRGRGHGRRTEWCLLSANGLRITFQEIRPISSPFRRSPIK